MKLSITSLLILLTFSAHSQVLSTKFPFLESNRGKGNGKLYYKLYSINSSNPLFPKTEAEYDSYIGNYGTLRLGSTFNVLTNSGTINQSNSSASNVINFNSSSQFTSAINNSNPYTGFNGNYFAVVVSGYFIPKQTGRYTFTVEGDDAVDIFINNSNVANHYDGHGADPIGTHTGFIDLIAGERYSLRARFQEHAGGEQFYLFWKKPSESSGSVWYQDSEELSSNEVVPSGLVYSFDPGNFYSYSKIGNTNAIFSDLNNNVSGSLIDNTSFSTDNGNVLNFDTDKDAVDFGSNIPNFPSSDISVFLWINATTLRSGWNIYFTKWFSDNSGAGGVSDFHYAIYPNGGQYFQNLYTTNTSNMFGSTPISTSRWYQVGFTLSNGDLQMYINGQPDGTLRSGVSRTNYTNAKLFLGDPRAGGLVTFNGKIGTVNVYNRAINREEVFQNFNSSKHRYRVNTIQFTTVGATTWTVPDGVTSIEYLIVGGGGGGGNGYDNGAGGGGGGGMVLNGNLSVTSGSNLNITVGDGGLGGANQRNDLNGNNGNSSNVSSIIALGGQGGRGSRTFTTAGQAGVKQVGNTISATGGQGGNVSVGGGGGGATANGTDRIGGLGFTSSISGFNMIYGQGGNGAQGFTSSTGSSGSNNTGQGGGAGSAVSSSSAAGGKGGSGIVILKYSIF